MVDIGDKDVTVRMARASVVVRLTRATFEAVKKNNIGKGNVLTVANVAGIQAAKKTAELIPLCHSLTLSHIELNFVLDEDTHSVQITSSIKASGRTGVEMEALTACAMAALTVYDMVKASQKDVIIDDLKLLEKRGGKSGEFHRENI